MKVKQYNIYENTPQGLSFKSSDIVCSVASRKHEQTYFSLTVHNPKYDVRKPIKITICQTRWAFIPTRILREKGTDVK